MHPVDVLVLRPATLRDAPLLRAWDEEPHVLASDPKDDWDWEFELVRSVPWREQWIAEVDGRPMGMLQIIDPGTKNLTTGAIVRPACGRSTCGSDRRSFWGRATVPG